ncbi:unnamed protein product [Trichogramma brassicae]|uniref:Uncharacterized protein n=1 Tax=Trichogramma brassicae TaxID=86971 RepID=A0A6H5IL91_9HYME|nr:unnamed protein product [Trichogramma brassicae]
MRTRVRPRIHCVTHVNFTDTDPRATTKICIILRKKRRGFWNLRKFDAAFYTLEARIWSAPGASPRSNGSISTSVPAAVIPQFF